MYFARLLPKYSVITVLISSSPCSLPPLLLSSIYGSNEMQWVSFQKKSHPHVPGLWVCICVCACVCLGYVNNYHIEWGRAKVNRCVSIKKNKQKKNKNTRSQRQGALWSPSSSTFHLWVCQGQQLSSCSCRQDQNVWDKSTSEKPFKLQVSLPIISVKPLISNTSSRRCHVFDLTQTTEITN